MTTADLAVTKSVDNATPNVNSNVVFTVTVKDDGPSDATGVAVTDLLPTGYAFVSATPSVGSYDASTGIWSVGSMVNGASATLQITAEVLASGSYANTASVVASSPADNNPSNNSQTVTLLPNPVSALAVTKDDGSTTYTAGGTATYTVVVSNAGPSDATNVTVTDALPAGLTLSSNVSCVATGTATCGTLVGTTGQTNAGTSGATIAAGAGNALTLSVPVKFASGLVAASVTNTVTAKDPSSPDASASDSDMRVASVSLGMTKADGSASYTPGGSATYVIGVTNNGPSDALDVTVSDALPSDVTLSAAVTCTPTGTATCGAVTGTAGQTSFGAQHASIAAGPGHGLTFTVPVNFSPGMTTSPLVNTATATDVPTGATTTATDSNTRSANVSLAVAKTDNSLTYTPGSTGTYVVTVTNGGTSDALSVNVSDPLPAGVTLAGNVTCVANGTSHCGTVSGSTGQSNFAATAARVGAGGGNAIVFTVPVAFSALMTTNPLVNTATAIDTVSGSTGAGSDTDPRAADVTLVVTKDDGTTTYTPGGSGIYTIVVSNTGISDAVDVRVIDALPAGLTLSGDATCVATGNAACGTLTGSIEQTMLSATGARVSAGPGNTLTFHVPVVFASDMIDDPLINTATATDLGSNATASGSDSDVRHAQAALNVIKTDNSTTYAPGGSALYVITVSNSGPSDALHATISDPLPSGSTLAGTVTCVASGVATCGSISGAAGSTSFTATGASIPVGAANTLTYRLPVNFASSLSATTLQNIATASDPAAMTVTATDTDTLVGRPALSISKTDNQSTYQPGGVATYVIVVSNPSPMSVGSIVVADTLPAGVTLIETPTCAPSGSATCGTVSGASGGTSFTANGASIAAGAGNSLTYSLPVSFSASMTTNPLVNTVTASSPTTAAVSAIDSDAINAGSANVDLSITKTHGGTFLAGQGGGFYSLLVTNVGNVASSGVVSVTDTLPAGLTATSIAGTGWNCVLATATCTRTDGLAPGASYPPIIVAVSVAPGASGLLVNRATVTGGGDVNGANNATSDAVTLVALQPDLAITKTHSGLVAGQSGTFTLVVRNVGSGPTSGSVTVTDTMPALFTALSIGGNGWSCTLATLTCVRSDVLAAGASYSPILITVSIPANATGTVTNRASVASAADLNTVNNAASDDIAFAAAPATIMEPIPALSPLGLAMLALLVGLLGATAGWRFRRP
ncbi:MAG TPA: DUF11 domain-containing protein [Casimicrobiaceae bacterium]|nr:DUF11 domain-containing protein [Casimicrobiaceae bacterium]